MKVVIGRIMIVIGGFGGFATGIYSVYLRFSNPDMTSTRIIIEHPELVFYSILAGLVLYIGYKIGTSK